MSQKNKAGEIKAMLVRRGVTITEIAAKEGVTRTWVSLVVNGRKNSRRVKTAIANSVGRKVEELWPE